MSLNPTKDFFSVITTKFSQNINIEKDRLSKKLSVPWWMWLTVLSLDAPIVAVLWQFLLADSFQVVLRPIHSLLLFGVVWLIYAADRCFDSLVISEAYTVRHAFYIQHFRSVVVLMGMVAIVLSIVILGWLEPTILLHGLILSGVVLLYLANVHLSKKTILVLPKELQIGLVFALGTSITLWSQVSDIRLLVITTLCFAILCFSNCSFISLWEEPIDVLHKQPSLARQNLSRKTLSYLLQAMLVSLTIFVVVAPLSSDLKLAFILSGLGLGLLQVTASKTSVQLRHVLADVVLMTPLLVLNLPT